MKKADKNIRFFGGGDKRTRTVHLLNAIQALYQMSYIPIFRLLPRAPIRKAPRTTAKATPAAAADWR